MKTCSLSDCDKRHHSKGFCENHYRRNLNHGSPFKGNELHGMTGTIEHDTWRAMKARCTQKRYKSYKAKGIIVCSGWRKSFLSFYQDLGSRPNELLSLDRIDNDGNYSCGHCEECIENNWPMNCRWATKRTQSQNRDYKSEYGCGVSKEVSGRFRASIGIGGSKIYLGTFDTREQASQAYLEAEVRANNLVWQNNKDINGKSVILDSYGKGVTQP